MGAKAGQARVLPISAAPSPRTSGDGAAPPQQQQPFPMGLYHQLPPAPALGGSQAFVPSNIAMGRPPVPRTGRSSDPGHSITPPSGDMDREQANSMNPPRFLPEHAAAPALAAQRRRSTAGDAALPPPAPVPRLLQVQPATGHERQALNAPPLSASADSSPVARPAPVQLQGWASDLDL